MQMGEQGLVVNIRAAIAILAKDITTGACLFVAFKLAP